MADVSSQALEPASDRLVYLDVGGQIYATSLTTLMRDPDNMIITMCDDAWRKGKGLNRSDPIFIDRDGSTFQYILRYLRDGPRMVLPISDSTTMKQLFLEAHYFHMMALCEHIYYNSLRPAGIWFSSDGYVEIQKLAFIILNNLKIFEI